MPAAQLLRLDQVPAGGAQVLLQFSHCCCQSDQPLPGLAQLKVLLFQQLLQLLQPALIILQGQRAISPPLVPKTSYSPVPPKPVGGGTALSTPQSNCLLRAQELTADNDLTPALLCVS